MIIYQQQKEPNISKTLINFIKIFEQKPKWHLHSNKWHRLKSSVAFQCIDCIKIQILELYSNRQPNILISISRPSMPSLKQLNLKNNKIESIQNLRDLDCSELRVLNLADNHLTQVTRALNKAYFPNLQVLILYANNIVEVNSGKTHLQMNFSPFEVQNNSKNSQCANQLAARKGGLIQLILGVNCLTDMRWINKISHTNRFSKISLQNNRSRQSHQALKRWKFDKQKILI